MLEGVIAREMVEWNMESTEAALMAAKACRAVDARGAGHELSVVRICGVGD